MVLIWNLEDREAATWVGKLRDHYEKYEDNTPQFRLGLWKQVWQTKEAGELFETPLQSKHFTQLLHADREKIWLRVLSKVSEVVFMFLSQAICAPQSYISMQPAENQAELKKQVYKVLEDEFGPEKPNERVSNRTIFNPFLTCLSKIEYPYKTELIIIKKI